MSKITLEPNSSGAGTFSIVSPDSNTNRTLNLPDEAGKLLSTGNNDPAEVFKQSNILGTVSESGGVPTGAIIERGSNSNGTFVKYADGTMICQGTFSGIDLSGFVNIIRRLFPANFSNQPQLSCSGAFATGDLLNFSAVASIGFVHAGSNAVNEWRFAKSDTVNGPASSATVLLTAIGRWY